MTGIIQTIHDKETKLLQVKNPTEINPATEEVDEELYKLAYNIRILVELKLIAGEESNRLNAEYKRKTLENANKLVGEELAKVGIVKSNKFKYIQMLLHQEEEQLDQMKAKYKYFTDMYECYTEWINILKKTRHFGG